MKQKHFTTQLLIFTASMTLVAASAFADGRHPGKTNRHGDAVKRDSRIVDRDAQVNRSSDRKAENRSKSRQETERHFDSSRSRGSEHRSWAPSQGKHAPYYAHGRVTKVRSWNNGYRVWVGGAPHPFYVPAAHWNRDRFRVGVTINLGGYYNPAGWYDYGCYACDDRVMRGVVVGIDYRRAVLDLRMRNGDYVTVVLPSRGERVRPGDELVVYGDWSRHGTFIANDIDVITRYRR